MSIYLVEIDGSKTRLCRETPCKWVGDPRRLVQATHTAGASKRNFMSSDNHSIQFPTSLPYPCIRPQKFSPCGVPVDS